MNPILQTLNGSRANSVLSQMNNIQSMLRGQNPNIIFNQMMNNNPQFAQFVRDNQGKTPEQIAQNYGIDPGVLNQFMKH